MKISREFKVGLISIFALIALYWGANYLSGSNVFESKRYFYAVYSQIDGLSESHPININGHQVGQIAEIYFHPDNSGRLMVKLAMIDDFAIPDNTKARIYSSGLLGEKAISLDIGNSTTMAQSGDTLISNIELSLTEEVNRQVAPLKDKAERLFASIDTVMILVSGFLNPETQDDFNKTFKSIKRSFTTLEHSLELLDTTFANSQAGLTSSINNLAKVISTLESNRNQLDNIFKNLDSVTDSLAQIQFKQTFDALNSALVSAESVLTKVDKGEGSAGLVMNDPELYKNLEEATEQLNLLMLDIKYNPHRYLNFSVFGGNKEYSEEEILKQEAKNKKKREQLEQEQN